MRDAGLYKNGSAARASSPDVTEESGEATPWEDKYNVLTGKRLRLTSNDQVMMAKGKTREDIARARCEEIEGNVTPSATKDVSKVGDVL